MNELIVIKKNYKNSKFRSQVCYSYSKKSGRGGGPPQTVTALSYQRPLMAMKTLSELSLRPIGYGRQAWYESQKRKDRTADQEQLLVAQIRLIRLRHHKVGSEKLYFQMKDWCLTSGICIGRDKFIKMLRDNELMIHRRSRKATTTNSRHRLCRYPNIIKGKETTGSNQVRVSDMTYLALPRGFVYMSLITDAYWVHRQFW